MNLKNAYEKLYNKVFSVPCFRKLLRIPGLEKLLQYEIVSYIFFGVMTTVVNFLVFFIANKCVGPNYEKLVLFTVGTFKFQWLYVANLIAWICSVIFAFLTNKYFVFESNTGSFRNVLRELALFLSARVVSFLLFEELLFGLIINVFSGFAGISWIAKIVVAVMVVIFNYIASKLVIFKKKNSDPSEQKPV